MEHLPPPLTVRRLRVDLDTALPRHWCDGDAFLTAFFNALSMSFPLGEQFFIDAVRAGAARLPTEALAAWQADIQGFVGQEATHRHLHARFNHHLSHQGLINHWEARARQRLLALGDLDPRHALAITAAHEHFTALLADWVLRHPRLFTHTEMRLATLWRWHSAEEQEHKNTAFDLYRALGGNEAWRRRWMSRITTMFLMDLMHQTLSNLTHDKRLWRRSTWRSAWVNLFGSHGLLRLGFAPWRRYFAADFHPSEHNSQASNAWLAQHAELFQPVKPPASPA